jgi:hypothetical protein
MLARRACWWQVERGINSLDQPAASLAHLAAASQMHLHLLSGINKMWKATWEARSALKSCFRRWHGLRLLS